MSSLPDFRAAYANLLSSVKENGQVILGDMQLAEGRRALFNPMTLWMSERRGADAHGLRFFFDEVESAGWIYRHHTDR